MHYAWAMRSLRRLMEESIDYAGLFPPAELPMRATVENFARHRASPERWMLEIGRAHV